MSESVRAKGPSLRATVSVAVAGVAISIALLGCGMFTDPDTAEEYVQQYGGDLADYQALLSSDDCAYLDHEWTRGVNNLEDTGETRWDGHFRAARFRYDALACELYGE